METVRTRTLPILKKEFEKLRVRELSAGHALFWCFAGVFLMMPVGISPALIFGALAAFIWFFSGMPLRVKPFFRQSWFWPIMALILLPWVGLLYTPDPEGLGINYAGKTYYWIFCLALASLSFRKVQPRWLIDAFLLGLAVNACAGILQLVGIMAPKQGWFSGLTRGYNTLTVYLVLGILICAFYFREAEERGKKAGSIALMLLYFIHLMIMRGRTGYLTLIILLPLLLKTLLKRFSVWKLTLVFSLAAGSMCFSPIVRERVELTLSELKYHMSTEGSKAWGREYTVHQDRFYYWRGAVEIFLENPVLGVGTGGYTKILKERRPKDDPLIHHPHNNFLYMAASYGVVGIFVYIWLFWELVKNGWKERDTHTGHLILCSALVLFMNGLLNTTILDAGTLLLLSLAAGLQRSLPEFAYQKK
ncbi:MAG: O-antigen ligase family protein [Deltaproteobacteria bacterium]